MGSASMTCLYTYYEYNTFTKEFFFFYDLLHVHITVILQNLSGVLQQRQKLVYIIHVASKYVLIPRLDMTYIHLVRSSIT